jgi:hypothetical protein
MDPINFDWLDTDEAIIDSLVASSTVPNNNASNDILQYLLQTDNNNSSSNFVPNNIQPPQARPPAQQELQNQMTSTTTKDTLFAAPNITPSAEFHRTLSVVQAKDNFVTFIPVNTTTKRSTAPKKTKFKEPIFVTESPQNAYNKKKKKSNSSNANLSHSSGEENSDDDMLLDEELASATSPSKLKHMTSKERRQLRNKISARNFRVRRKG